MFVHAHYLNWTVCLVGLLDVIGQTILLRERVRNKRARNCESFLHCLHTRTASTADSSRTLPGPERLSGQRADLHIGRTSPPSRVLLKLITDYSC